MKYEYGVEYGNDKFKKPDLPGDTLIEYRLKGGSLLSAQLSTLDFDSSPSGFRDCTIVSFKVVDDRFRQKPTSNDWFERGELPPVGVECEMLTCGNWIVVFIIGIDNETKRLVVRYKDSGEYFGHTPEVHLYRPIRTEREKAIEAAINIICKGNILERDGTEAWRIAMELSETGLLRLPEEK